MKDIDEQLKENTEKAEKLEAELRKLADEADSDIRRLDEQSVRNAVDDNEAVMEDIRGQLGELALLLRSPEHDENEFKKAVGGAYRSSIRRKRSYMMHWSLLRRICRLRLMT